MFQFNLRICSRLLVSFVLILMLLQSVDAGFQKVPTGDFEQRVYIFRGVGGYWPRARGMAKEMSCRGYCPDIYCSLDATRLTKALLKEKAEGKCGPINLIGYSFGASAAVRMAECLGEHGIPVDRLVIVECFDHPVIPENVIRCVNIYETRCMDKFTPFRGTPAAAASAQTYLTDIDIACDDAWGPFRLNNHFTMATDPRIQRFIAMQFPDVSTSLPTFPYMQEQPVFYQPPQPPTAADNGYYAPQPIRLHSQSPFHSYR